MSSTKYSGSVAVNNINGSLDVKYDSPIRYGFIVIWSDFAMFGVCAKFVC